MAKQSIKVSKDVEISEEEIYELGEEVFDKYPPLKPYKFIYKLFGRKIVSDGIKKFNKVMDKLFDSDMSGLQENKKTVNSLEKLVGLVSMAIMVVTLVRDREYAEEEQEDEEEVQASKYHLLLQKAKRREESFNVRMSENVEGYDLPNYVRRDAHTREETPSFDVYAPKLDRWEGRTFTDNPNDAGGATFRGVTLTTFREIFGKSKTVEDLKNMTEEQWRKVMKDNFWDVVSANQMRSQAVAEVIVDWTINSGRGNVIPVLQEIVGATKTGKFDETLRKVNEADPEWLVSEITRARKIYYNNLTIIKDTDTPKQVKWRKKNKTNLQGWINRANAFGEYKEYPELSGNIARDTTQVKNERLVIRNPQGIVNRQ